MRRLPILLLVALLMVGLMPVAASAGTVEEEAAIQGLETAAALLLAAETSEEFVVAAAASGEAIVVMKAVFPGCDYAALDTLQDALEAAILVGNLAEINTAADALAAEAIAVAADASAGECADNGTTTTIGEVVTDIPDGGSGPNAALLGVGALLVLLSGAALAHRASVDRR